MPNEILVAMFSLIGTVIGSLGGILASSKLTIYRLEQLEKKVEKHNNVIERVYQLEKHEAILDEEIEHLKDYHK